MTHKLAKLKTLRVAVVGGGFAGLSIAQRLSSYVQHISIIDMMPPGKAGASSAAGGLLHPLSSRGGFIWRGIEGFEESKNLLDELKTSQPKDANRKEIHLYDYPVEIYRPLLKQSDVSNWLKAAQTSSKDWLEQVSNEDFQSRTGFTMQEAGILQTVKIKNAIVVNPINYLLSLWQNVQRTCPSTEWRCTTVSDLNAVTALSQNYDTVILAVGPTLQHLWSDRSEHQLFLKYVKGQNQLYRNDNGISSLRGPLLSGEYIVPRSDENSDSQWNDYLVCGATHEHMHRPTVEDIKKMMITSTEHDKPMTDGRNTVEIDAKLKTRLTSIYPYLQNIRPFKVTSGVRLVTERTELGKLPIVGRHPWLNNVWVLAGLGARGLVYHALMAKYLHQAILEDDQDQYIPKPLQPVSHYLSK